MNSERYSATLALIDRLEEVKNKSMGPHDAQAALNDFSGKPDPDGPWHAEIGFCGGIAAPVADLAALLQEVFAAGVVKGSTSALEWHAPASPSRVELLESTPTKTKIRAVFKPPTSFDKFINDALTLADINKGQPTMTLHHLQPHVILLPEPGETVLGAGPTLSDAWADAKREKGPGNIDLAKCRAVPCSARYAQMVRIHGQPDVDRCDEEGRWVWADEGGQLINPLRVLQAAVRREMHPNGRPGDDFVALVAEVLPRLKES